MEHSFIAMECNVQWNNSFDTMEYLRRMRRNVHLLFRFATSKLF